MTGRRGSSLVEAMVGLALGALASGVLAASVLVGVRALTLANGVGAQVAATYDGIERLRLEAPGETSDLVGAVPQIERRRQRVAGRGRPSACDVESTWTSLAGDHPFEIEAACWP
jgi:hypothetical protein